MITVRTIGPSEAFIAARFADALLEEETWPPKDPSGSAFAEIREGLEDGSIIFVAFDRKTPVGMLQVSYGDHPSIGKHLNAGRYYVLPEYRNRGIGRKLIEAMVNTLPAEPDYPMLCLTRGDLPASYRKLGFRTVSQIHEGRLSTIRANVGRRPGGTPHSI